MRAHRGILARLLIVTALAGVSAIHAALAGAAVATGQLHDGLATELRATRRRTRERDRLASSVVRDIEALPST